MGRTVVLFLRAACGLLLLGVGLVHGQADGMEEFPEVDPYTKGKRELMQRLGYVSFGPFVWRDGDSTAAVQVNMGDIAMVWVETEHFRIGSSLATYKLSGDREEKGRIKQEIARLKSKLGKMKVPRSKLDPWLRLHLYAQRAEGLYAAFHEDFDLTAADYADKGPYLGHSAKHLILLCERKSEFIRHLRIYVGAENESSYRWGWQGGGLFYGANVEAIRERWPNASEEPVDSMLYCSLAENLTSLFVDGFRMNYGAPHWLATAVGHLNARRIDARFGTGVGLESGRSLGENDYKWEGRIGNLVKNDFFAKSEDMFGWLVYEDMNIRDHMVAWSRLEYLLSEAKGDRTSFLMDVCEVVPECTPEVRKEFQVARQTKALGDHFGLTPAELDKAWARWVKKTYKKR